MKDILLDDFKYVLSSNLNWEKLSGKVVLVTGGTGFIGSLIIRYLNFLNDYKYDIKVIAIVRDVAKAEFMYHDSKVKLIKGDVCNLPLIKDKVDFIFHCAATTRSKDMVEHPTEVSGGIVNGTMNICKLANEKQVKSMVYLSSMEVYGATSKGMQILTENDLGSIEILNTRSCYSLGKRMAENICYSYYVEYNVPIKIARLAQTFGAGILPEENRVFAQFAKSVIENRDIILHTMGDSRGNYCYSADSIVAIFKLLLEGEDGEAYNIVNEETSMTIFEMAELVAQKIAKNRIKVIIDIANQHNYGFAPKTEIRLSAEKMKQLGWKPTIGLLEAYQRMIKWLN
ncbi:NAD-dependent epimerase/dehydratase family protein [Candidatus Clostridium helianthi]|uniref:NAD-dependent epimerase/dehydratase family protein n=1 Tax=Candidatus Clostridium helianthi TaxID=3381660 RepID=A0ABW8S3N0_9CLOT